VSGLRKVEINYSSKSGAKAGFTLNLIFACTEAFVVNSLQEEVLKSMATQKSYPNSIISKITNDGLVQIKFSRQMNATKEELAAILNSSVLWNGKSVRILEIKLSNPNGVI
jgi:hypothetical protein